MGKGIHVHLLSVPILGKVNHLGDDRETARKSTLMGGGFEEEPLWESRSQKGYNYKLSVIDNRYTWIFRP